VIAKRLGSHRSTISLKRTEWEMPSARTEWQGPSPVFGEREIAQLGKATDAAIAATLGRSPMVIRLKRAGLGIPPFRPMAPIRLYSEADIALLGTDTDHVIGALS
jgi:hypothetical protein